MPELSCHNIERTAKVSYFILCLGLKVLIQITIGHCEDPTIQMSDGARDASRYGVSKNDSKEKSHGQNNRKEMPRGHGSLKRVFSWHSDKDQSQYFPAVTDQRLIHGAVRFSFEESIAIVIALLVDEDALFYHGGHRQVFDCAHEWIFPQFELQFHPTVHRPPLFSGLGRNRPSFAEAYRLDARWKYSLLHERFLDCLGSLSPEPIVLFLRARGIGMTFDNQPH